MTPNALALTDLSGHNLIFNMEAFMEKEKARAIDEKKDEIVDDVDEFSD